MIGEDTFGPDFQRVLVRACMEDPGLKSLVYRFVQAGQLGFTDPGSAWAWGVVAERERVSSLMMGTEAARIPMDSPARIGASVIVAASPDFRDDEYVRAQVVEWARRQVFRAAFDEARQAWNNGDIASAQATMTSRFEEMDGMRLEMADRGWFFEELGDRQQRRLIYDDGQDSFPIGIDELDRAMDGGLSKGELEIALAYSGIGKTFWCVQRGFITARLRRKCLHIVLEGGRKGTEDRYEARFAETLYRKVKRGQIDLDTFAVMQKEYEYLRKGLVIRAFGDRDAWQIGYNDILAEMAELRRSHGWVPDMVVVDYGDLMAAPGDSEYQRQKIAYRQLKALSERQEFKGHHGYAVCSPSQAQRPAKDADEKEHILRPRDIADCYEKIRVANVVITINRTLDEKEAELARVSLGKYRDAEDGIVCRVSTDYTRGGFSVLGAATPPPPPPKYD